MLIALDRSALLEQILSRTGFRGWTIVEQDERSTALLEIDVSQIKLVNISGDRPLSGVEHIKQLKTAQLIRLDARVAIALWENETTIPATWAKSPAGSPFICFDGTVLQNSHGHHYGLCLCRYDLMAPQEWLLTVYNLRHMRYPNKLSAILRI